MKKIIYYICILMFVTSCASHKSVGKVKLDVNKDSKNIIYVGFNEAGGIPNNIKSGNYKSFIDGTAIKNCSVYFIGETINKIGYYNFKIDKNKTFGNIIVDCSKGSGIAGEKYNIKINLFIDGLDYYMEDSQVHS